MVRWRGRQVWPPREQVANAYDDTVDLSPATVVPAAVTSAAWSATLPGQVVPLVWERVDGDEEERI